MVDRGEKHKGHLLHVAEHQGAKSCDVFMIKSSIF